MEINVYPNPTTGNVFVAIPNSDENTVAEIYNMMGQMIITQTVGANQTIELPLGNYAKGMYTLRLLNNGKQQFTSRVIKE